MLLYILLGILTLFISAFFSGIEMAYVSSNALKVEVKRKSSKKRDQKLMEFFDRPSKFLGTTLVGNNIALVFFGIIVGDHLLNDVITNWLPSSFQNEFVVLLIITCITTIIVLIFGEFLPKAIFRAKAEKIMELMAWPLYAIWWLLTPVVWCTVELSYLLLRVLLRTEVKHGEQVFTKLDLENFIRNVRPESEEEIDRELFENALYLPKLKVRESMIPRTEIVGIDVHDGVEALRDTFIEHRLSRIIIYDDTLDDVLGYAHHQKMLENPKDIKKVILPMQIVPEVMAVHDLLNLFIKQRISIAHVVDEFGGTAGIITMEDIVEELVGEIEDEHDDDGHKETVINENEFLFSGRLEVDYINEKYDIDIPEGEYHTLSGYIVSVTETIPEENQQFEFDNYRFILEEVSETKIELIRIQKIEVEDS